MFVLSWTMSSCCDIPNFCNSTKSVLVKFHIDTHSDVAKFCKPNIVCRCLIGKGRYHAIAKFCNIINTSATILRVSVCACKFSQGHGLCFATTPRRIMCCCATTHICAKIRKGIVCVVAKFCHDTLRVLPNFHNGEYLLVGQFLPVGRLTTLPCIRSICARNPIVHTR